MEDADVIVDPAEVELDPASAGLPRVRRGRQDDPGQRRDPARVLPARARGQAEADRPALPRLAGRDHRATARSRASSSAATSWSRRAARLRAKDTGEREELECGLVLRSVGYTGIPIEGVPFDEKRGTDPQRGRPRARLPRRRPQGRPLHRRLDQARPLGRDRHQQEGRPGDGPAPARRRRVRHPARARRARSPAAVEELLAERGVRYVSFEDWQAIDQAEVGRGEPHGRPRVKFVRVEEMLDALGERVRLSADAWPTWPS